MATKKTTPEQRKTEVKEVITPKNKEVVLKINIICDYGEFLAGKTYKVTPEVEKKLIKAGAI